MASRTLSRSASVRGARTPFGALLREWRSHRGKSQLALALDAGVSGRHLSFLESGRAEPSREMVLLLARALDVPFRDCNLLLESAGYARHYGERALSDGEARLVNEALDLILTRQEPFPAVVMDRHWNILRTNSGADRLFGMLLEGHAPLAPSPPNVLRLMFHPDGLRPHVTDWRDVAESLLQRVRREAVGGHLDRQLRALVEEVLGYPGVGETLGARRPVAAPFAPILPVGFERGPHRFRFFSTVTTLGTPQDIALQEIRVECFFPADDATRPSAFFATARSPATRSPSG